MLSFIAAPKVEAEGLTEQDEEVKFASVAKHAMAILELTIWT